jgi:hypothetical protein
MQVLGNHRSAVFGQALPCRRRGCTAAETMGCAMGGLDVSDLVLFIGATLAASFVAAFAFWHRRRRSVAALPQPWGYGPVKRRSSL